MSIDELYTTPCPNCGAQVPNGMHLCPNCGYQQSSVWPPQVGETPSMPVRRKTDGQVVLEFIGGFLAAAAMTTVGMFFMFAGPIVTLVLCLTMRKKNPEFANGLTAGLIVGLIGIGACFAMLAGSKL